MKKPNPEAQGKLWSTTAANWARYIEPTSIPLYREALHHLALGEENMLLDAGCGSGLFLSMASATGAQLHGIDTAAGMLSLTRQRVPEASLLVEDLEALPFIDGTFDVVTGFDAFSYANSFERAITEARRVVKRHGIVAIGTRCNEEACDARAILTSVSDLLPTGIAAMDSFLINEDQVEAACKAVGLKITGRYTVCCPWAFNSDAELLNGFLSIPSCATAASISDEAAVQSAILQSAQPHNLADEVYYLRNHFTLLVTTKL